MKNLTAEAERLIQHNNQLKEAAEKRAGVDSEKVQKTVSEYLQIARDNQLNYIELLRVFAVMKDTVLQSLNNLPISASVDTVSYRGTMRQMKRKAWGMVEEARKMHKELDHRTQVEERGGK